VAVGHSVYCTRVSPVAEQDGGNEVESCVYIALCVCVCVCVCVWKLGKSGLPVAKRTFRLKIVVPQIDGSRSLHSAANKR
jgi:hypothetical protein